jgi:hypothetical protein
VPGADADHPAPGAVAALRTFLKQHPDAWRIAGDLGHLTRIAMLKQFQAPPSLPTSVEGTLYWLRRKLQREGDGALEQLAIDAILTAWLDHQLTVLRFSKNEQSGMSFKQPAYR